MVGMRVVIAAKASSALHSTSLGRPACAVTKEPGTASQIWAAPSRAKDARPSEAGRGFCYYLDTVLDLPPHKVHRDTLWDNEPAGRSCNEGMHSQIHKTPTRLCLVHKSVLCALPLFMLHMGMQSCDAWLCEPVLHACLAA